MAMVACGWMGLGVGTARGDIQQPPKPTGRGDREIRRLEPPATAVPARTRVALDGSVEIVLEANGGEGKNVDFILRDEPTHGALAGPPRQLTRNTAVVTYVHRAEEGAAPDGFTFAVQARGGKVSAAAPVVITVADAAPELAASPAELDFGAVNVGETSHADLTLENRGGGVAAGRLSAPIPWEVDGSPDYHLARGERATFRIVFRPNRGDAFVEAWRFAGENGRATVRLIGTGLGPPASASASAVLAESAPAPPLMAVPDTSGRSLPSDRLSAELAPPSPAASPAETAAASLPTTPSTVGTPPPAAAAPGGTVVASEAEAPLPNRASVTQVEDRGTGSSTIDLAWTPPTPSPRSYRVEMRYLLLPLPEDENKENEIVPPRIEWREYARTDIRVGKGEVTAHLRGLSPFTIYALRVVAVDGSGRAADPSLVVFARTQPGSTFWHLTPLKVLGGLLLICVAIYLRRRWQERQALIAETEELERSLQVGGSYR